LICLDVRLCLIRSDRIPTLQQITGLCGRAREGTRGVLTISPLARVAVLAEWRVGWGVVELRCVHTLAGSMVLTTIRTGMSVEKW
jgi:hypothetical protein